MAKEHEELRMAKFLVKHTKHTVVVFKYDASSDTYIEYKTYFKNNSYAGYGGCVNAIKAMRNNTEFTAVYSKTAGIKTLYQILGVRGEDFET